MSRTSPEARDDRAQHPRILVLRGGALGDFVITLPALGLLRSRWPQARIELVGNTVAAALAVDRHYLDAAHSQGEARWSRLGSGTLEPDEPLGRWLRTFSLVVSYWPDPDEAIARDLMRVGFGAPEIAQQPGTVRRATTEAAPIAPTFASPVFISHPAQPDRIPAAAHFCAALAPLGLTTKNFAVPLHLKAEDLDAARGALGSADEHRTYIAWHPGSGSPRKNWPLERWLEVISTLLREHRARLLVLLGEVESASASEIATLLAQRLSSQAIFLRSLPTPVLAAVLQQCALFLGHDSGPAHVAAAAGCPCILVFGPTDPAMWAPPYPLVRALRRGRDVADVSLDDVRAAVADLLSASQTNRQSLAVHSGPA